MLFQVATTQEYLIKRFKTNYRFLQNFSRRNLHDGARRFPKISDECINLKNHYTNSSNYLDVGIKNLIVFASNLDVDSIRQKIYIITLIGNFDIKEIFFSSFNNLMKMI